MKGSKLPRLGPKPKYNLDWNDYYSHDDINEFIDELAATYDYVSTASIGQSYEGRDMRVIQIAKAGPGKPNIFVEAGKACISLYEFLRFVLLQLVFAQAFMPVSGLPMLLPPTPSWNWWRIMMPTPNMSTTSTFTSSPWPTLMVMSTAGPM